MKLFSAKDKQSIKRIQDAFSCCGFNSPLDMAFPFQDARHGADACLVRYERDQACFEPWRREERKVAIMLLVVPLAVFVWKVRCPHLVLLVASPSTDCFAQVAIILSPSSQSSWLASQVSLPSDSTHHSAAARRQPRPAIGYRDIEEQVEDDSLYREVTNLNKDSNLATHVEGNRQRAGPFNEANEWREGGAA